MLTPDYHHEVRMEEQQYLGRKIQEYAVIVDGKTFGKKPVENLFQRKTANLIGRTIIKYSISQGDFGDGSGPGFLGLLLAEDATKELRREWMIVTILVADDFALLDREWVSCSANFFHIKKPLIYHEGPKFIDNFGPIVNGSVIKAADLKDESLTLTLEKDGKGHELEILNKDPRLTPLINFFVYENGERKYMPRAAFKPGEKMGEYIVFMEENGRIYV